jgi:superfamily I DNA/RNA helicase
LGTRIKGQEKKFIQLTQYQLDLFNRAISNSNLITTGPAGSGKTIAAKILAKDLLKNGEKILFLCFNRTLANKIRYEFDKNENSITISTFHSFSKRLIDIYDPQWWDESKSKSDDFWSIEVPVKLSEYIDSCAEMFDTLIIDEGQDFKEYWYEILFKLVAPNGKRYIFLDENQNIFENFTTIPNEDIFFKYNLPENCRNTKTIVNYLSEIIKKEIKSFGSAPFGEAIVNKEFSNLIELQKYLIEEVKELIQNQNLDSSQILFMLNTPKEESCISSLTKIGNMKMEAVDNKGRLQSNCINYTTINQFKGLEADVVFILDANKILNKKLEKLYTEASRARFKLYIIE